MATLNTPRHQMIRKAVLQKPGTVVDVTIRLWEKLASELISIIGEGGFQSMYSRSLHLAGVDFPWMEQSHPWHRTDEDFLGLRSSFEGRDLNEISEASIALLTIFIDILATLIGELLTTNILCKAWGDDASDIAGKETT
jgi:hypothetical protein